MWLLFFYFLEANLTAKQISSSTFWEPRNHNILLGDWKAFCHMEMGFLFKSHSHQQSPAWVKRGARVMMLWVIQIWLNWSLNLHFHHFFTTSLSVSLSLCPLLCPFLRSLLSFPLRGWLPWRRPQWPLLDPEAKLSNPLSEWREDGALLQEGLCGRPPSRHWWRWIASTFICTDADAHAAVH